jgi:hypothetical protein
VLTAPAAPIRAPAACGGDPARTRHLPAARGFTLAELVVTLGLSGVAFGAFAIVVAHQERTHAELSRRIRARSQSSAGLGALGAELRAVAPEAGDIPPGGARDSAIEFRATVGSLVVCELRGQTIVAALASFMTPPQPADTAWAYVDQDTAAVWLALAIGQASLLPVGGPEQCATPATAATVVASRRGPSQRYSLTLSQLPPSAVPAGTPVRVTRHIRYSLYRGPDGQWHLGRREWSAVRGRFETIQPVSGPYDGHAALRFFDENGAELPSGTADADRIARIGVALSAPRAGRDVIPLTIAVRNR